MKKIILSFMLLLLSLTSHARDIGVHFSIDQDIQENKNWDRYIDVLINQANDIYAENNIDIQLYTTTIRFIDLKKYKVDGLPGQNLINGDQIITDIWNNQNTFNGIHQFANQVGADYIVAITGNSEELLNGGTADLPKNCGIAFLNNSQELISEIYSAGSVMASNCDTETFVHELGHSMGLIHGDLVDKEETGITAFAEGFGVRVIDDNKYQEGEFGTIMVHNHISGWTGGDYSGETSRFLPIFSDPNLNYMRDIPANVEAIAACGIGNNLSPCGNANTAHAARALRENIETYASHEEPDVGWLTYSDTRLRHCLRTDYANVEILGYQSMSCASKNISTIDGMEKLVDLTNVDLSNNNITNLDSLLKFPVNHNFSNIDLRGNNTALCHQLDELEGRYPNVVRRPDSCLNIGALTATISYILS